MKVAGEKIVVAIGVAVLASVISWGIETVLEKDKRNGRRYKRRVRGVRQQELVR